MVKVPNQSKNSAWNLKQPKLEMVVSTKWPYFPSRNMVVWETNWLSCRFQLNPVLGWTGRSARFWTRPSQSWWTLLGLVKVHFVCLKVDRGDVGRSKTGGCFSLWADISTMAQASWNPRRDSGPSGVLDPFLVVKEHQSGEARFRKAAKLLGGGFGGCAAAAAAQQGAA